MLRSFNTYNLIMLTAIVAIIFLGGAFALIGIRVLLLKDGEFKGTCSTNNPFLREQGVECPVCGASSEEACRADETKSPEQVLREIEG
ncbi:MAG: membrane or secreted protein [Bacteroidetes bacterium]|nr:membrane or secreted protein [Bacteroidota bacterium]